MRYTGQTIMSTVLFFLQRTKAHVCTIVRELIMLISSGIQIFCLRHPRFHDKDERNSCLPTLPHPGRHSADADEKSGAKKKLQKNYKKNTR